jgi:hypothetical protein
VTNYLLGNDPSRWRTGIVSFAQVRYGEVYPGVDLVYYGSGRDLEYDFVVSPGADPSAIRMLIEGAERVRVDETGDLVLEVGGGEIRQRAPAIYQDGPAGRERVPGGYAVHGDTVTFVVGAYDPTRPLVVDPVIVYSRWYINNGEDYGYAVAVDADGCAYYTGYTLWFEPGASYEVFVAKLSPTGSALVYLTYLGGSGDDIGYGIALGTDRSAYVAGWTGSQDFPTASPLQANIGGDFDGFVLRLSPSGSALVYSTYLGGNAYDVGTGIAVGGDGSAVVSGYTQSPDFPTASPYQACLRGPADAFVAKLSPSGA